MKELIEEIRLLLHDHAHLESVIGTQQRLGYEDAIQDCIYLIQSKIDREKYYGKSNGRN